MVEVGQPRYSTCWESSRIWNSEMTVPSGVETPFKRVGQAEPSSGTEKSSTVSSRN